MKNDTFLVEMGLRIAGCRKELHLTQEQLAENIDVSLQTISCIELGKKAVRPENLAKLCKSLQVSSDYVLYGKRDAKQMEEVANKLASLGKQEYDFVCELVAHFDRLCSKR
ncbi:MAG: helix-turn-helix transcriptional regulator [Clostridia bacterium]|nr:helix-turn-helix transcriptional regulator [Clostridia bacterium]